MSQWHDCAFSDDDDVLLASLPPTKPVSKKSSTAKKRRLLSQDKKLDKRPVGCVDDLWLKKYKPSSLAQVAGNRAKVGQLKEWLEHTYSANRSHGILLITGPSGCGKTAAVEAITKELDVNVSQWGSQTADFTPVDERGDNSIDYESQTNLFDNFILRAAKYQALPLFGEVQSPRQMVLVEDIPNVYLRSPAEWHNKLRVYTRTSRALLTIIFNTSGAVTERAMFPDSLQTEVNIKHFAFNPVPKTDIKRLLTVISDNERHLNIPKDFIASLSESCDGDIRTAVNTLQFTFAMPPGDHKQLADSRGQRSKSAARKKSTRKDNSKTIKDDNVTDDSSYHKDPTLVIFRALGKVLHCKRTDCQSACENLLPAHLRHHARCDMSFNPEQVFEQAQVSSNYYNLCLHQNYPHFLTHLENVHRAIDYLSHSDCLSQPFTSRHVTGQAPIEVSVAARGLMHSNTSMSQKQGWLPLHKPHWFTCNKQQREHQTNLKWNSDMTVSSATTLAIDLIPALHLMKAKNRLSGLIPPLVLQERFTRSLPERMDDKFGRDDISKEINDETEMPERILPPDKGNEDEPALVDDPEEFLIETVD